MPIRKGWLPREGFTADPVGLLMSKTVLNPAWTLPLILLARYTQKGRDLGFEHGKLLRGVKTLLVLGLWRWTSNFLDSRALNNWSKDEYDWSREVVVITGGSDGMGKLVVQLLAERGIKVVVLDIQPLKFEPPSNVHYFNCDIRSTDAIASAAAEIRSTVGKPTILVNNAGVARGNTVLDSTEADVRFTFDVNTLSHYWLAKEFLPDMVKKNHGMVVTVASLASHLCAAQMVDYASSKAAALALHEGLATELKTRYNAPKVRTVIVTPGHMRTPLFTGWNGKDGFLLPSLEPETVAEKIVTQILSGQSGHVVAPESAGFVSKIRGWPYWMQYPFRNTTSEVMSTWTGRQVLDPNQKQA